jgi:beta-xylosidase
VKKGQWTSVSGRFTVPADADINDSIFFIESGWGPIGDLSAEENKAKHLFDLSIDNVVLVEDVLSDRLAANEHGYNGSNLKLQWQWNHNPNNNLWSLIERPGFLRLKSGSISRHIHEARNTLTQRTFGPTSSAEIAIEIRNMNDGDVAGLSSYQNQYGFVGVKQQGLKKYLVMQRAEKKDDAFGKVIETLPLDAVRVYLKVDCDFRDKTDKAAFYYSLDGERWTRIGDTLQMAYDWPHFMGQRFGLFYYSTRYLGGCVDFDYFRVSDRIENSN